MTIQSIYLFNNETLKTFEPLTKQQTLDAIATSDEAFSCWRHAAIEDRKAMMLKIAEALPDHKREFAASAQPLRI